MPVFAEETDSTEIEEHEHNYDEGVVTKEATCTKDGVKTFICECGYNYTEIIAATGHSYKKGNCTECGEVEPDFVALEAGLYDADGNLLCTWADSGINITKDYTYSNSYDSTYYRTCTTSGYYVLKYNYPTATKVVIPDNVTSIGNYTFYNCSSLSNITISESITSIGSSEFYVCTGLTSIEIQSSVTSIKGYAFQKCTGLDSVTIPDSVTSLHTIEN